MLEDLTHVIGGAGLGFLLYPPLRAQSKPLAYSLLIASTALHLYADIVKPRRQRFLDRAMRTLPRSA